MAGNDEDLCGCSKEFEGMMEETAESLDLSQGKGQGQTWEIEGQIPGLLRHRFTGMGESGWGGEWVGSNLKGMIRPTMYLIQTRLVKSLLKEAS